MPCNALLNIGLIPSADRVVVLNMQTDCEGPQQIAAAQSSLRVGLAAAWLGSADGRPSAGLLRELLADAAAHPAASLQATAALLAPAYLAAAASMSAAGLSQVHADAPDSL